MVTASFPLCLTQGVHPIYPCVAVSIRGPKTKLRKLTERQTKHAIWPRIHTDAAPPVFHRCPTRRSDFKPLFRLLKHRFKRQGLLFRKQLKIRRADGEQLIEPR